jgi:peptide methionine sulfoxide reductase msrA/msrB
MKKITFALLVPFLFFGCHAQVSNTSPIAPVLEEENDISVSDSMNKNNLQKATFAGGCFWCMEGPFEAEEGVSEAISGYAGGEEENPTYEEVVSGKTGHREAVQIVYDPHIISYERLLEIYWKQIDPTDDGGQFADRGFQYTTAVFFHTKEQKLLAEESKNALQESGIYNELIVTDVLPYLSFYPAEEYHQDFYKHSAERYGQYKKGSGRAGYISENSTRVKQTLDSLQSNSHEYDYTPEQIQEMRKNLDPLSWHVVSGGTEQPFDNAYWDNKDPGIYVDTVTGEPLFSSTHKYDSGTGWPSFYKSIKQENIEYSQDTSLGMVRTEIRSEKGDTHLGHVFDDGPVEKGGKRFCVNSASLRFIPKEEMEAKGYKDYLYLFQEEK